MLAFRYGIFLDHVFLCLAEGVEAKGLDAGDGLLDEGLADEIAGIMDGDVVRLLQVGLVDVIETYGEEGLALVVEDDMHRPDFA